MNSDFSQCYYTVQGELMCGKKNTIENFDTEKQQNSKSFDVRDVIGKLVQERNNCAIMINTDGELIKNINVIPCHARSQFMS
jgi:hypothetical protein